MKGEPKKEGNGGMAMAISAGIMFRDIAEAGRLAKIAEKMKMGEEMLLSPKHSEIEALRVLRSARSDLDEIVKAHSCPFGESINISEMISKAGRVTPAYCGMPANGMARLNEEAERTISKRVEIDAKRRRK